MTANITIEKQYLLRSIFLLAAFVASLNAMSQNTPTSLADYFQAVRDGAATPLPYELVRDAESVSSNLNTIRKNLSDTLTGVRKACYQLLNVMQQNAMPREQKMAVLSLQLSGVHDELPDHVGLSIGYLSLVSPGLFTDTQKEELLSLMGSDLPKKGVLVRLVGTLETPSAASPLRELAQPGNPAKVRWAAYLALSRLGEEPAITFVSRRVRGMEVNDDLIYDMVPDVIFTRQRQLYDYLVELLHSNEQNCESADPDQLTAINCAYRILEALAPEIVDFPIRTSASGDLQASNYREALQTAREWFGSNPDYQIK